MRANTDASSKLSQLKESYLGDRKVYATVEEFMADRQMLIDLVVARRQHLQVRQPRTTCCMGRAATSLLPLAKKVENVDREQVLACPSRL